MVTKEGLVKILDFGVAKPTAWRSGSGEGPHSPTMTETSPASSSARPATCRPSRPAASRWTSARTSSPSDRSSTRWRPASGRSRDERRSTPWRPSSTSNPSRSRRSTRPPRSPSLDHRALPLQGAARPLRIDRRPRARSRDGARPPFGGDLGDVTRRVPAAAAMGRRTRPRDRRGRDRRLRHDAPTSPNADPRHRPIPHPCAEGHRVLGRLGLLAGWIDAGLHRWRQGPAQRLAAADVVDGGAIRPGNGESGFRLLVPRRQALSASSPTESSGA